MQEQGSANHSTDPGQSPTENGHTLVHARAYAPTRTSVPRSSYARPDLPTAMCLRACYTISRTDGACSGTRHAQVRIARPNRRRQRKLRGVGTDVGGAATRRVSDEVDPEGSWLVNYQPKRIMLPELNAYLDFKREFVVERKPVQSSHMAAKRRR
eukprot:4690-Rhodomonas_salina.1